jgi:hypothetical protein
MLNKMRIWRKLGAVVKDGVAMARSLKRLPRAHYDAVAQEPEDVDALMQKGNEARTHAIQDAIARRYGGQ